MAQVKIARECARPRARQEMRKTTNARASLFLHVSLRAYVCLVFVNKHARICSLVFEKRRLEARVFHQRGQDWCVHKYIQ